MAVKDIQRRHMTVFNVRFGEKKNGHPAKLRDQLRITSASQEVVQAFADVYSGTVRPWEEGFEVYIPRTDLPIFLLPGQSITQWWTLYKGSVCERRCDGEIEQLSGKACMCPDGIPSRMADSTACSLETRLNFICPEVAVVGAGALVTRSLIGGETLPQAVSVAEQALAAGQMVPARLRAVQKVGKGKQYVIPQIEITGFSLQQLLSGEMSSGGSATEGLLEQAKPTEVLPAAGAPGGRGEEVAARPALAPAARPSDSAVQGRDRPAPPPTGTSATAAQRASLKRLAARKGLDDGGLETLVLDTTGKYLDEADFSVGQLNEVLAALGQL